MDCALLGEEFEETGPLLPLSPFQMVGKGSGFNIYVVTLTLRSSNCYITMFSLSQWCVCIYVSKHVCVCMHVDVRGQPQLYVTHMPSYFELGSLSLELTD